MIGEACRFYGWTPEYALKMPASQFFVMLDALRRLRNSERVYECFIARAGTVSKEGFNEIIECFEGMDIPKERPEDVSPAQYLKGESARAAMASTFGMYGRQGEKRIAIH